MTEQSAAREATRAKIIEVALRLFRSMGYKKTTVADIAQECAMSPANVYRFFDSKLAINEAVCAVVLAELQAHARDIARRSIPAAKRIRAFINEMHEHSHAIYIDENRLHDMVRVAMEQQWSSIATHVQVVRECIHQIISDGIANGEFPRQDVAAAAEFVMSAEVRFCHPELIEYDIREGQPVQTDVAGQYIVAALTHPPEA